MPNTREKLIEKINKKLMALPYGEITLHTAEEIADSLIEEGFVKDNNAPSKWISVKDGLPKLILCDAGTAYSEAVNVLTTRRKVLTAIWDGFDWICDAEFWDAEFEEITHWTPVPLPLPQPTKGE